MDPEVESASSKFATQLHDFWHTQLKFLNQNLCLAGFIQEYNALVFSQHC